MLKNIIFGFFIYVRLYVVLDKRYSQRSFYGMDMVK